MEARAHRRHRRRPADRGRGARAALGVALALALAAARAPAQEAEPEARAASLVEALDAAPDEDARAALRAELLGVVDELRAKLWTSARALGAASGALAAEEGEDLERRLALLEVATTAALAQGGEEGAAWAQWSAAALLLEEGRLAEVVARLEAALARYPGATRSRPYLLLYLAEALRRDGRFGRALAAVDELDAATSDGPDQAAVRELLPGLRGQLLLDLGLPDRAWPYVEAAWRAAEEARAHLDGEGASIVQARLHVVNHALATADHARAVALAERFLDDLDLYDREREDRAHLELLRASALSQLERRDPARAPAAEAALRELLDDDDLRPRDRVEAWLVLAELRLRTGRREEARAGLAAAADDLERLRAAGDGRPPFAEEARLVALELRLALAEGAPRARLEALHARAGAALDELLVQWSRVPERPAGVGFLHYDARRSLVAQLALAEMALEPGDAGRARAIATLVRVQRHGSHLRRAGGVAPTLAELRAGLASDEHGVLVYLPAVPRTQLFAFDRGRLLHVELASQWTIERARRAYLERLEADPADHPAGPARDALVREERALAAELAGLLLPPELDAPLREWRQLTVVGLDSLGVVPFAPLPCAAGPALGRALALDRLPSLPFAPLLRARADARRRHARYRADLLLVGDAAPGDDARARWPGLAPLPLAAADVAALTAPFAPARTELLLRERATPAALRGADGGAVGVLQLLVHGVLDREDERPVALLLTPDPGGGDGVVRCADAGELPVADLVLLASCRTGHGPLRRGDPGAADMGGAWLAAGSQCALVSQGELSFRPVLALSETLLARVAAGDSPAEALRRARVALEREYGALAPFHDGLLEVVGLGHAPVFASERGPTARADERHALAVAAPLALLAAVLGYLLGRRVRASR